MVTVAGKAHLVVVAGCTQVLEHAAGGYDSVKTAGLNRCFGLCRNDGPHLVGTVERFCAALGLGEVMVRL